MKKTIQTIVLAALCLFLSSVNSMAQTAALNIGDKIPEKVWNLSLQVLNHPQGKKTISLNDYRGKLIILDFWATWCAACIANFPKAGGIQDSLPGKVNFLAITYEDENKASAFFESRRAKGISYDFPSVVHDSALKSLFPHRGVPHYVWIDPAGTVRAISTAERLTIENIRMVLNSGDTPIPVKKDMDTKRPLFLSGDIREDDLSAYSILTKGSYDGLPSGNQFRRSGGVLRGRGISNSPVLTIYLAAISPLFKEKGDLYSAKRLVLEVADTSKVNLIESASGDGTYQSRNLYNYELIVPVEQAGNLYRYMLEDLNRYTDYHGRIEQRKVKCLILVRTGSTDKIRSKGAKPENSLFFKSPARLNNYPISFLARRLNDLKETGLPVIDETGYSGNVDLEFSGLKDLATLKKELRAYGLDLKEDYRTVNMFILADKSRDKSLFTPKTSK